MRGELGVNFSYECIVASSESINKIRYGTLCISRYHQIRKIFMSYNTRIQKP